MSSWHKTACILCSQNCGIEVEVQDGHLVKIHGDKDHPASQGYACEKAQRLDYYQNARDRISRPLRRRKDGTFEAVDWDTAIAGVAAGFQAVKSHHGGEAIFHYGGGGQGNHLGGAYGRATRAALGSIYGSNALAQEKTGEFWVDGKLFGRPRCHTVPDLEHAEVAVFIGKNPWQSHGFPRARAVLREIAADPKRCLVVIDPRRTETADLAHHHLQVKPGTDVFCLSALLAVMVQEKLCNAAFVSQHTRGFEALATVLGGVDVAQHAQRCGIAVETLRTVARRIASAASVATLEDLGIQQAPHSTLNSYLEKLLYLLTGNFGRTGTMNIHTRLVSLGGGREGGRTTPVGGHRIITGLVPANVIPDEILTDHPKRFRAMLVESANPAHSLADSARMRQALGALEFLVVVDVAMTETARLAHYVLPASSQYEKWEATFFNLEFPNNVFHLRAPVFPPLPGTLPEAEIHTRLVKALGAWNTEQLAPLHAAAARVPKEGRGPYAQAFFSAVAEHPQLMGLAPAVLYETLGPVMPHGARDAAVLWGATQTCAMAFPDSLQRAGFDGDTMEAGDKLFEAILNSRSGVVFTVDEPAETWKRVDHPDGRIMLDIPELLEELAKAAVPPAVTAEQHTFPFVLAAGERRTSTANTIFRDPAWRKKDAHGALRMCPQDAQALGVVDGSRVKVTTQAGSALAVVEVSDTLLPGHITLPNGLGLDFPDVHGTSAVRGVAVNELTSSAHRDWLAGTPWHKHVPARLERVDAATADGSAQRIFESVKYPIITWL